MLKVLIIPLFFSLLGTAASGEGQQLKPNLQISQKSSSPGMQTAPEFLLLGAKGLSELWNRLSREVVDSPSLDVFKIGTL